ncbi:DUF3261 domain-containing protein [Shewanella sp. 125m-1]
MSRLSQHIILLALGSVLLTACSQTLQRQTCVELAQDVNYCLAPVAEQRMLSEQTATQPAISVAQKVTIKTQASQHELLSQLELDQQQLTLVGLAPLGQALFTLTYDDYTLVSEQSQLLGDQFNAEYLLAIMQLIYWPDSSVNRHLQGAQIRPYACDVALCRGLFFAKNEAGNETKQTPNAEQPIIAIRYSDFSQGSEDKWQAQVQLSIDAANFTLAISPI